MHVYRNSGGQAGTTARFVEAAYNVVANAGDRALLAAKESTFFFFLSMRVEVTIHGKRSKLVLAYDGLLGCLRMNVISLSKFSLPLTFCLFLRRGESQIATRRGRWT